MLSPHFEHGLFPSTKTVRYPFGICHLFTNVDSAATVSTLESSGMRSMIPETSASSIAINSDQDGRTNLQTASRSRAMPKGR